MIPCPWAPQNVVVLGDSNENLVYDSEISWWPDAYPGTRHDGNCNVLYADWHVESVELIADLSAMQIPWPKGSR